jgi:hypothetical protein
MSLPLFQASSSIRFPRVVPPSATRSLSAPYRSAFPRDLSLRRHSSNVTPHEPTTANPEPNSKPPSTTRCGMTFDQRDDSGTTLRVPTETTRTIFSHLPGVAGDCDDPRQAEKNDDGEGPTCAPATTMPAATPRNPNPRGLTTGLRPVVAAAAPIERPNPATGWLPPEKPTPPLKAVALSRKPKCPARRIACPPPKDRLTPAPVTTYSERKSLKKTRSPPPVQANTIVQ